MYFRSDRNGEYNLFAYDVEGKDRQAAHAVRRLPGPEHRGAAAATSSSSRPAICTGSTSTGKSKRLKIGVAAELPETPARGYAGKGVPSTSAAPRSPRAGHGRSSSFRGEIVTVPAEKGDVRNLTQHARRPRPRTRPGRPTASRSPTSRDDGRRIPVARPPGRRQGRAEGLQAQRARLLRGRRRGRPTARRSPTATTPRPSTGSTWTAANAPRDRQRAALQSDPRHAVQPGRPTRTRSPTRSATWPAVPTIYVYSLEDGKSHAGHRRACPTPSSRASTPPASTCTSWPRPMPARSTTGSTCRRRDLRANAVALPGVLQKDMPSPFAPESDEEKGKDEKKTTPTRRRTATRRTRARKARREPVGSTSTGWTGGSWPSRCRRRTTASLQAGEAGQVFYLSQPPTRHRRRDFQPAANSDALRHRQAQGREAPASGGRLPADARRQEGSSSPRAGDARTPRRLASPSADASKSKLNLDDGRGPRRPAGGVAADLREAWRINRDYFYDPNMHGADWPAMQKKYEQFLPHAGVPRRPRTGSSAGCSANWPSATAAPARASGSTSRRRVPGGPARGRLRNRRRPLPLQEGLRRR